MLTKSQAAKFRKLSRELALKIKAEIIPKRCTDGTFMYYVHGPDEVYADQSSPLVLSRSVQRDDPFEHDHYCLNWQEVYQNLLEYEEDLIFHDAKLDEEDTDCLKGIADKYPEFAGLLSEWLENRREFVRLNVMADWIEEHRPAYDTMDVDAMIKNVRRSAKIVEKAVIREAKEKEEAAKREVFG